MRLRIPGVDVPPTPAGVASRVRGYGGHAHSPRIPTVWDCGVGEGGNGSNTDLKEEVRDFRS
jgi:hypothetical protein